MGYLHLDIKPDNILINQRDSGQMCLIDYGISEKYVDDENKHREQKYHGKIFGNLVYMSKYALQFKSQSRRDDLIGFLYMLVLLVKGKLPWQSNKNSLDQSEIILLKQKMTPERITEGKADDFCPIIKLLYTYGYDEEPEYNRIKFMF